MAEHEGSFLDSVTKSTDSQHTVPVSTAADNQESQSLDGSWINNLSDNSGTSCDENSLNSSFWKRRHPDKDPAAKGTNRKHSRLRPAYTVIRKNKPLLDDDSLTDLGITGFLDSSGELSSAEEEVAGIFPTPSPTHDFKTKFSIHNRFKSGHQPICAKHPEITKNRAITLFDSPEESRRGWSELGLRIRRRPEPAKEERSDNITGDGYFSYMADELVLSIFKSMPKPILVKCARVCKRWKRLAYDESLWKHLDLSGRVLPQGILGNSVLNRGCEYLRLSSAEVLGQIFTHRILRICKLQYLDLTMASVSTQSLNELLSHCKHLQKLSLEHVTVNEQSCRYIAQNKYITTLNCAMAEGLNYTGLQKIFQSCERLQELNISWTCLAQSDVRPVLLNLPRSLTRLNFSGCRDFMTDHDVELLVSVCPDLLELDLSDSLGLTEKSLYCIQQSLVKLQALHLSRCYYIIPQSFSCLNLMPELQLLSIHSMMQEDNLIAVMRGLPSIQVNTELFSTTARPTVAPYRTSIWGHRVRDLPV